MAYEYKLFIPWVTNLYKEEMLVRFVDLLQHKYRQNLDKRHYLGHCVPHQGVKLGIFTDESYNEVVAYVHTCMQGSQLCCWFEVKDVTGKHEMSWLR